MKRQALGLFACLAGTAVLVTWPLAAHLGTHLPVGREPVATVLWFNLWTMEWNAERLLHGYAGYWDAPIFHPAPLSFALSEPQPLTGFAYGLLRLAVPAATAYALLALGILIANGLAGFRLLRVMGAPVLASSLAGLWVVGLPYVLLELGVIQLAAVFPILMCFSELVALQRAPTFATALRLAAWIAATLFSCAYYAAFLSVFLVLAAFLLAPAPARRAQLGRWLAALAVAAVLAGLASAPVVIPQRQALAEHTRGAGAILKGSASARRYARADPRALAGSIPWLEGRAGGRNLYPGLMLCALAFVGWRAARRGPDRRWVLFCAAGLGLALFVSFGRRVEIAGVIPYELIFERGWPGFSRLRSPYRCAVFVQLFLVALAGLGLAAVQHSALRLRGRPAGPALAVLLTVLGLLEVVPRGQALARFPAESLAEPWVAWLRAHPGGAVAMVPPSPGTSAPDYLPTTVAMLQGLRHEHPLLDGYSGFFPRRARLLRGVLHDFPSRRSLEFLRQGDCRYVVASAQWLKGQDRTGRGWRALREVHRDSARSVFELGRP